MKMMNETNSSHVVITFENGGQGFFEPKHLWKMDETTFSKVKELLFQDGLEDINSGALMMDYSSEEWRVDMEACQTIQDLVETYQSLKYDNELEHGYHVHFICEE